MVKLFKQHQPPFREAVSRSVSPRRVLCSLRREVLSSLGDASLHLVPYRPKDCPENDLW